LPQVFVQLLPVFDTPTLEFVERLHRLPDESWAQSFKVDRQRWNSPDARVTLAFRSMKALLESRPSLEVPA